MPNHFRQQMLTYEDNREAIKVLGEALDLLGRKQVDAAIEKLMAYRNHLQECQRPRLRDYDPREDHP